MWKKINPVDIKVNDIVRAIGYNMVPVIGIVTENNSTKTKGPNLKILEPKDNIIFEYSGWRGLGDYFIWTKSIPESYKTSDCCKNCKHIFVRRERKAPTEYYCHIDKSERPLCGSILMGESEINPTFSWDKWEKWKKEHYISDQFGKCNFYER
jgi:hypothetical protein